MAGNKTFDRLRRPVPPALVPPALVPPALVSPALVSLALVPRHWCPD